MDNARVSVAVVGSRPEAELIVGLLSSYGLGAFAATDDAGGREPQLVTARVFACSPASGEAGPVGG